MPYSTTDLATLEAALASGALTIEYADRRVTYRDIKELKLAIQTVKEELALVDGSPATGPGSASWRRSYASWSPG
jgi:hypothetical protein